MKNKICSLTLGLMMTSMLLSVIDVSVNGDASVITISRARGRKPCGLVLNDEKHQRRCEGAFLMQQTNPVKNGGNHRIENHAIEVRKALDAHRTLNGLARRSDVEQILFGSPQGSANIGVALITYTVEFYEPMEDFTIF